MANFNPGLEPTRDPDYSGESRLDRSAFQDRAGEMIARDKQFAAQEEQRKVGVAARLANTVLDTVNWGIEKSAEDAIKQGVQPIRDEQGGGTYGLENESRNTAQVPGMAPPVVSKYAEGLTKLQAQYDQGVISDTRYYEQLEVLTRQVKSRFPGYEDHIDRTIHRITGVTPANALREARMAEMKASASESQRESDKRTAFLQQHIQYLRPGWETRPFEENREDVRLGLRHKEDQEELMRKYNLADKERSASEDEKKRMATTLVTKEMDEFRRTTQPIIDEAIAKVEAGKAIDPKDAEGLAQAYEFNLKKAVYDRIKDLQLPAEEVNRLTNMAMEDTKLFRQTLISGDASMLKQNQLHIQAMADENYRRFYEQKDIAKTIELIKKLPQPLQQTLFSMENTPLVGPVVDALKEEMTRNVPGGTANPQELPKETQGALNTLRLANLGSFLGQNEMTPENQLKRLGDFPAGRSAVAVQSFLEDWSSIMTNSKYPDEVKKGAIDKFFKEDNIGFLRNFATATDKQAVFRTFTSPAMVAEMQKHKGTPQYDQYSAWVKQNFHHVFKSEIDNLADVANRPYVNLEFNESTGKFLLVPTEEGRRVADEEARKAGKPSLVGTMNAIERLHNQAPLEKSVNELNAVMDSVKPIVESEGFTFQQEIKNLIHFESIHDKKNSTLWQTFLKNSNEGLGKMEKETFGGQNINFSEALGTPGGVKTAAEALKAAFSKGESGDNYNRLVNTPTHPKEIGLTSMPIKDVLAYQQGMLEAGNKSSAAGKYQVVSKTLRSLVREGVVSLEDKYDEATQEKIADALLERRGLSSFLSGKKSLESFMKGLGDEWEIIKKSPAAYHKVMLELEKMKMASMD